MIALTEKPEVGDPAPDRCKELLQTVSASRLTLWQQCRLKFFFRHVQQIRKPPTPAMHSGSTVHAVLQQWNLARWRKQPFSLESFKAVFASQWNSLQDGTAIDWEGEEDAERDSAWRAVEHYFMETPIKADEKPEAVEVAVEAALAVQGLPTLVGIIDLVRADGRIVDFKLVGKAPDPRMVMHTYEVQLTAYSLLYRDATGRPEGGLELHHLVRTKVPKAIVTTLGPASEKQLSRLFKAIASYCSGVERQDFVPSVGFQCAGCEFWTECRNWS